MPQIKSSFILRSKAPNFERDSFKTLSSMKNVNPGWIDEGHISYCRETRKHYVFSSYNEYDETTGYFRLFVTNTQSGGSGDSSSSSECSCGVNRVFNTLEDMRNVSMISSDIDLGSIVYCKETKLPYYSDYDPKLPPLDSNQAYFDDETGYFRSFTVSVDVKDLQEDLNDLADRVTNLENNGTPSGPSGDYITEEELNSKGYLTEIPSEYITESELNDKGYLVESDITQLKTQLAGLLWSGASFSLSGGRTVFANTDYTINLAANFTSAELTPDRIDITLINNSVRSFENTKTASYNDPFNKPAGTYTYTANAYVGELSKRASTTVTVKNKVYCAMGKSIEDVMIDDNNLTVRTSVRNVTYTVTASDNNQHFYLIVPVDVQGPSSLNSFSMGGAPVAIESETTTFNGINYTAYKTVGSYDNGTTLSIKVE